MCVCVCVCVCARTQDMVEIMITQTGEKQQRKKNIKKNGVYLKFFSTTLDATRNITPVGL